MRTLAVLVLLFTLLSSCLACHVARPPKVAASLPTLISQTVKVDMTIYFKDEDGDDAVDGVYGTGFSIDDRYILTAGHVCQKALDKSLKYGVDLEFDVEFIRPDRTRESIPAFKVIKLDPARDLCLLSDGNHHPNFNPVFPASLEELVIESSVTAIAGPQGFFPIPSSGKIVSPDATEYADPEMLNNVVTSIFCSPGCSGSPIFNEEGKLVGMVTTVIRDSGQASWGPNIFMIQEFIKDRP